jgi:hypothetical protein
MALKRLRRLGSRMRLWSFYGYVPQRQLAQSSATLHGWERHVTPNCEHNAEHNNRFSP